jgi:predicted Zn-dependent peptidase
VAKIEAVTVDDVRAAGAKIFRQKPTLATIGPIGQVPKFSAIIDRLAA